MKMGSIDLGKVALVFGMIAFQLHILTMTVCNYILEVGHGNHRNNVIQAFIIIAYLLYIFSLLLLLVLSYSNLKGNKGLSVFTAIILFLAASSVIIGLAVYDAETYGSSNSYYIPNMAGYFSSYTTTTYVTAAASGYVSCLVLLVSLAF